MKTSRTILLFVLVTALLLSIVGCQGSPAPVSPTPVATQSPGTATQPAAPTGPQFGGTLTVVDSASSCIEPAGWDIHSSPSISSAFWLSPVQEYLFIADVLNKGPRGTKDSGFNMYQAELPADFIFGNICSSYELSPDGLVATLHVREGIKWQPNSKIGMAARELTADDVAYFLNRYRSSSKKSKMSPFTDENPATVIDKYTVQLNFTKPFASWMFIVGYALYANVYPKEMVDAGADSWEDVSGTGPFILDSYVQGSEVTYVKNPDWWNKAQTIDGNSYNVPFIDKLVYPIMPDEATRISALIAGKVDIEFGVRPFYRDILTSAAPDLQIQEGPTGLSLNLSFNCLSGPAADLNFRRALMLGTDEQAIAYAIPGSRVGGFPFSYSLGESVYTPVDQMPEEVAKLYTYDPDTAAKQIADLGYAGATIDINYQSTVQDYVTIAELLADQWKKLGLNVNLNVIDPAVYSGFNTGDGSGWSGVLIVNGGNGKTSRGIENERAKPYFSVYTDTEFNNRMDAMMAETDPVKRDAMMKEDAIYFIGQVNEFALVETSSLTVWWPWVKNYYGETEAGCSNLNPMLSTLWIDQELKKSMGY